MEYDPLLLSRRRRDALASGLTDAELRTPLWTSDLHGVVRPAFAVHDEVTTHLSNAVALLGPSHVLAGWAAFRARGSTWFSAHGADGTLRDVPVLCLPGGQLRARPGVAPWRGMVHRGEHESAGTFQVATFARAAFDEMCRSRSLEEAVVVADMAASTTTSMPHTTLAEIGRVIDAHHKVRGVVRARRALALAHTRAASPQETRTRLLAERRAGFEDLLVNAPVFDLRGNLLGVADLLDPTAGVVIESDGDDHHAGPRTRDNHRQEGFERGGLVVCRVTRDDHAQPSRTAARLAAARHDALAHPRIVGWTLTKPRWWATWRHAARWE